MLLDNSIMNAAYSYLKIASYTPGTWYQVPGIYPWYVLFKIIYPSLERFFVGLKLRDRFVPLPRCTLAHLRQQNSFHSPYRESMCIACIAVH